MFSFYSNYVNNNLGQDIIFNCNVHIMVKLRGTSTIEFVLITAVKLKMGCEGTNLYYYYHDSLKNGFTKI